MVAGYLRLGERSHGEVGGSLRVSRLLKGGYDETVRRRSGRINQQSSPWAMGDRVEVVLDFSENLKEGALKGKFCRKAWLSRTSGFGCTTNPQFQPISMTFF